MWVSFFYCRSFSTPSSLGLCYVCVVNDRCLLMTCSRCILHFKWWSKWWQFSEDDAPYPESDPLSNRKEIQVSATFLASRSRHGNKDLYQHFSIATFCRWHFSCQFDFFIFTDQGCNVNTLHELTELASLPSAVEFEAFFGNLFVCANNDVITCHVIIIVNFSSLDCNQKN